MHSVVSGKISAAGISPVIVDREIGAGARLLRFCEPLETVYEAETGGRRRRQQTMTAMFAVLCFNLFLFVDFLVIPDIVGTAAVIRLLIVSPLTIVSFLCLRFTSSAFVRESVSVLNAIVITTAMAAMTLLSESPLREIYNHAVLLIIIYAAMVQRIRFWYAVFACAAANIVITVAVFLQDDLDLRHIMADEVIIWVGTVFALVAAYNLEREQRLLYLMSLKERLRTKVLEVISNRDALTGLFNRRALDARLGDMRRNAGGQKVGLSIIILDIDHFKVFNDTLGHQAGDDCLKQVAAVISAELRDGQDLAFRYGGEEFLIITSETDLTGACLVAERIRKALEQARIRHPNSATGSYLTASFGVAYSGLEAVTPAEVIASADIALYAAKRNGRNQVWPPFDFSAAAGKHSHYAESGRI